MIPSPNRKNRRIGFWLMTAVLGFALIASDPALAQSGPDVSPITDLLNNWQNVVIRIGQAALGLVVTYHLVVVGVGSLSSASVKKLLIALVAMAALESVNKIFIDPARNAGNSSSSPVIQPPIGVFQDAVASVSVYGRDTLALLASIQFV